MTESQYLLFIIVSAAILLAILQFLKRRFPRNEPPVEFYNEHPVELHKEDIARPSVTSSAHMN
jgi:hypothetical protein